MSKLEDPLLNIRPTINPYRRALSGLVNRLRWDINLESWRSRRKIRKWKDAYSGEKAVILCNGPSLLAVDLNLLDGVFTFGLNKINLLFDKTDFRPSCIVAVNPFVIEQNTDFFNTTDIPLFLDSIGRKSILPRDPVAFLHSAPEGGFAQDCSISIYQGYTVTYVAMQIAFHMGFREVALVGCDHSFSVSGPANAAVEAGGVDDSHFDPNYFSEGMKWHLPDLEGSEMAYSLAGKMYQLNDRRIFNATEGGRLELFERVKLEKFVST